MKFPSFYAECAFADGQMDARTGSDSTAAFRRHGELEPVGMEWYRKGFENPNYKQPAPAFAVYRADKIKRFSSPENEVMIESGFPTALAAAMAAQWAGNAIQSDQEE